MYFYLYFFFLLLFYKIHFDIEIDAFLDDWQELASGWGPDDLYYGESFMLRHPEETQRRLLKAFNSDKNDTAAKDTNKTNSKAGDGNSQAKKTSFSDKPLSMSFLFLAKIQVEEYSTD